MKYIPDILCILCYLIICTSCVNIVVTIGSRMNIAEYIIVAIGNLELYNLNHLKLSQLLIDGDVESNPGPVDNKA